MEALCLTGKSSGPDWQKAELCTLHLSICWYEPCLPFILRLYFPIWLNEWQQWDADGWQPKSADLLHAWQQTLLSAGACCCISTDVHHQAPYLSLLSVVASLPLRDKCQCVGMYRCWSVIVRGQARADGNMSAPPSPPLSGTWLFVRGSGPFCQATGDPWPLNPSSTGPELNPNSYILMSRVQRHPPPDTLPDKDTCMLPLIRPSVFLSQSSLWEVSLLQVISAVCWD